MVCHPLAEHILPKSPSGSLFLKQISRGKRGYNLKLLNSKDLELFVLFYDLSLAHMSIDLSKSYL